MSEVQAQAGDPVPAEEADDKANREALLAANQLQIDAILQEQADLVADPARPVTTLKNYASLQAVTPDYRKTKAAIQVLEDLGNAYRTFVGNACTDLQAANDRGEAVTLPTEDVLHKQWRDSLKLP